MHIQRNPASGGRRRHARNRAIAIVLVAATALAACGGDDDDNAASSGTADATATEPSGGSSSDAGSAATGGSAAAAATGTINVGMAKGDIDSIDPNRWWAAITWGLANGLCTTLLRYADQAGAAGVELVPGLADMPTVSADGTEYTFTLKEAYFANGDRITPEDIKHTFLRLYAPDVATGSGGYMHIVGADPYANGDADDIPGITTSGDTI